MCCLILALLLVIMPINSSTISVKSIPQNNITIQRVDIINWKYKIIQGKRFKRKYNSSTKRYIGKWILDN